MSQQRIDIEYNKIKNLNQYRNFTEEQLRAVAFNRALEYQLDIKSLFPGKEEREMGSHLAEKYLDDYTPETISDINTLRSIIFLEVLNTRMQNESNNAKQEGSVVDLKAVETMHKNLNQISILKDSLGLSRNKRNGEVKSVDQAIGLMRKQFKVWMDNNQASREAVCPYCAQHFLLRIRMDHWEAQRHPFFRDRILYNKPLVDLHLQGVITKDKLAEILECSVDYVDWVLEKVHKQKTEPLDVTTDK